MTWRTVCPVARVPSERGVCALVDGTQVALFRTVRGTLHALGNQDPVSGAMVLSRGIVGTRGDRDVVVSPMFKQAFDLVTGECLDLPEVTVATYEVRVHAGFVAIDVPAGEGRGTIAG